MKPLLVSLGLVLLAAGAFVFAGAMVFGAWVLCRFAFGLLALVIRGER